MKVKDVMSTKVEVLEPHYTLRTAARKMKELNVGSMPVMENGQLLGIITDRDISVYAIALGYGSESTLVDKMMTRDVFSCQPDSDLSEAAKLMEDHKIRRLAVLDDSNGLQGVISVDDIARVSHDLAGAVLEAATPVH